MIEVLSAVALASYALISGAFLNAAITAPRNCRRTLDLALNPGVHENITRLVLWGVLALFAGLAWLDILPEGAPEVFVWLAAAHLGTIALLYLSRAIAALLIDGETEKPQADPEL